MPRYVTLGTIRPLGWLMACTFGGAAGFALHAGEPLPALGFVGFSLLGVYLLVGAYGQYAVEDEALYAITPFGWHYRLPWTDVRYVECGTGGTLVFHGDDKRFVLPPVAYWSGEHKPAMYERMVHIFEVRKLLPVPSNTADYRLNKNVRVADQA